MGKITTIDMLGNKYEVESEQLTPSVHVYGIAIRGGQALVVPQFDGYDWPGGTFELGEDTVDTLKREFKEETGYDVKPKQLLGLWTSFFHHPKRNKDYHSLLIYYLVEIVDGEISDAGFDADEREYARLAEWVDLAELPKRRLACSLDIADELLKLAQTAVQK